MLFQFNKICLNDRGFNLLRSFVIALPLGHYLMQQRLNQFAYKIEVQWWIYTAAGTITVLIAFLTISFKTIKSGLANPIESLRSE